MTHLHRVGLIGAAMFCYLAVNAAAFSEEMKFTAELKGSEEIPPVESTASGTTTATYDTETKKLSWTLEYTGLSSDATAAHFHGPADPGANAGPVVPIADFASGSEGSADLTDQQAADLQAGKWYVNVHSTNHPDGEIRGQVKKAE